MRSLSPSPKNNKSSSNNYSNAECTIGLGTSVVESYLLPQICTELAHSTLSSECYHLFTGTGQAYGQIAVIERFHWRVVCLNTAA